MTMPRLTGLVLVLVTALAGCARGDKDVTLKKIRNTGEGPDEFSIVPGQPLQAPDDFSSLPPPTPGAPNLTDPDPRAQSIAALGGNPDAVARGTVPAGGSALLDHTRRFGVDPAVRERLAREDREVRRKYGRVNIIRIGPNDNYTQAYEKQWLDAARETERLRRRGVLTPAAPPGEEPE